MQFIKLQININRNVFGLVLNYGFKLVSNKLQSLGSSQVALEMEDPSDLGFRI